MAIQLAWIGLGNMGRGMARNLAQKGHLEKPLLLYNRTLSRTESLAEDIGNSSVKIAKSVAEAVVTADVIFTCLASDDAIKETMRDAVKVNVAGKIFIDCTTVHPDVTEELASLAHTHGAELASMTVLGSPAVASAGLLICILAGPAKAVDTVKPFVTGIIGRTVIECRDEAPGKADLLKIVVNMLILNVNEVLAEGLTFAEKVSIDAHKLHELVAVLFGRVYATYSERMISGAYHKKDVPIDMALKDAGHAFRIATDVECTLPSLTTIEKNLQAVKAARGSSADSSAVYGVIRQQNGLSFEN